MKKITKKNIDFHEKNNKGEEMEDKFAIYQDTGLIKKEFKELLKRVGESETQLFEPRSLEILELEVLLLELKTLFE